MTIYLSLLVAVVGAFVYAVSKDGKACELGRITFGAGLLAFLLHVSPAMVGGALR